MLAISRAWPRGSLVIGNCTSLRSIGVRANRRESWVSCNYLGLEPGILGMLVGCAAGCIFHCANLITSERCVLSVLIFEKI